GVPVRDRDDLFLTLGTHLAGTTVQLDVRPAGKLQRERLEVTLAKFYVPGKKIASVRRPVFRGLRVDYTSLIVQQQQAVFGNPRIPAGVLVTEVQPGSTAATALLKAGDVITHVNGRPVATPAAFHLEVNNLPGRVELTLAPATEKQPSPRVTLP